MEAVFAGKHALVIGGTGGIGRAVALGLAKKGAAVTITGGSSPERLESALTELNAITSSPAMVYSTEPQSGEGSPLDGGVSNALAGVLPQAKLQAEKPQDAVFQPFAPPRLCVNSSQENVHSGFLCRIGGPDGLSPENAAAFILEKTDFDILVVAWGPFIRQPLHETKPQDWRVMVENNLIFPGILVSSVLPRMIKKKWGRILLFGGTNTAGIRGFVGTAAYGAAKTALGVLAKSTARSAGKHGVTCNVLCPGLTETEYTGEEDRRYYREKSPDGKALTPEEIAACALAVLANSAINGIVLPVDRGIWV